MAFNARDAVSVHRASAALAAAGAYDTPTAYAIPDTSVIVAAPARLTFVYAYTLSVASGVTGDGYARIRPTWVIAGQTVRGTSVDTAVVAADLIRVPVKQLEIDLPNPPSTSVANVVVLEIPPGATAVSFPVAEVGDTDHPGTFASWITVGD